MTYIVGTNTLGYVPDVPPEEVDSKEEAVVICQSLISEFDDTANEAVEIKFDAQDNFRYQIGPTAFWIVKFDAPEFSAEEIKQMEDEGWSLFFCPWTPGEKFALQKTLGGPFAFDAEARAMVNDKAVHGSKLHQKVCLFLQKAAPEESEGLWPN